MPEYVVKAEDKLYKGLSFEESYALFQKLSAQEVSVSCYPIAEKQSIAIND